MGLLKQLNYNKGVFIHWALNNNKGVHHYLICTNLPLEFQKQRQRLKKDRNNGSTQA